MLLEKVTARKEITLASEAKLYAHGALIVVMEFTSETDGSRYHITQTKADLLYQLSLIEKREGEIENQLSMDRFL